MIIMVPKPAQSDCLLHTGVRGERGSRSVVLLSGRERGELVSHTSTCARSGWCAPGRGYADNLQY